MIGKIVASIVAIIVIILCALGYYWDKEPAAFSVVETSKKQTQSIGGKQVVGSVMVATTIKEIDILLNKRGGFLSNDITPPSIFMDNIPYWEVGALTQIRDFIRIMRDSISRSQSQSTEDSDLVSAESYLTIHPNNWQLPNAQDEYQKAADRLSNYLTRLSDDDATDAQFYARADNLSDWLQLVEARLGSMSQRLSASVGQKRINTDLANDGEAKQSTPTDEEIYTKTPWLEIDDVFYEARGSVWALLHLLKAAEVDFAEVLKKKNATVSLAQIIRELEETQQELDSPLVLNGSGFGLWANHSLVMASYISRANAAVIDLRELLAKG